jgi:uncharacterized protein (DUF1697 family)
VALLRGINVGGRHMLPMAALAGMFEEAGCRAVRTYIQSGNVAFAASPSAAKRAPRVVAERIEAEFGFRPHIMMRTSDEIANIASSNPLLAAGADVALLHVGFLDRTPDDRLVAKLDPARSPSDRFVVRGREIYVQYTNGVLKTKLTGPYFDSTLSGTSTFRNWRTVLKLAEMVAASRGV